MSRIFISYRRDDSIAYAGRLYDRLIAHFGKERVFMDMDTIEPGEDFVRVLEQTVASCDVVIALVGKQWLLTADAEGQRRLQNPEDFVRIEIAAALKRKIRVIPALVGGARMPRSDELPPPLVNLARRHAIEISDTAFHHGVDRLIKTLEKTLNTADQARQQQAVQGDAKRTLEAAGSANPEPTHGTPERTARPNAETPTALAQPAEQKAVPVQDALGVELRRAETPGPTSTKPWPSQLTEPPPLPRPKRRWRKAALITLLSALLGAVLVIAFVHNIPDMWSLWYQWRSPKFVLEGTLITQNDGAVAAVVFSPDEKLVAELIGGKVQLWDAKTGEIGRMLQVRRYWSRSAAFNFNGAWLATGGDLGAIIWEVSTGRQLRRITSDPIESVAFSPDHRNWLVTGGPQGARIWDGSSGGPIENIGLGDYSDHVAVDFRPDQRWVGILDGVANIWSYHNEFQMAGKVSAGNHVYSMVFSPDGRLLGAAGEWGSYPQEDNYGAIKMWDVATGREVRVIRSRSNRALSFSSDGRWLVCGGYAIEVYDVANGRQLQAIGGHTAYVSAVAVSPSGQRLASGQDNGTLQLWRRVQ